MGFKKILPRTRGSFGELKVSFTGSKTNYANIYISHGLLEKLGWPKECRVCVYFDENNQKIWMLEKTSDEDKEGFKLISNKDEKRRNSKIQFKFSECKIEGEERKLKSRDFEINEGKILIKSE